jgi:hypothetical protein
MIKLAILTGRRPVIPMTITDEVQMHWFCGKLPLTVLQLTASRETILRRIHERGHDIPWGESHLDEGLRMKQDTIFGHTVATDGRSITEVAKDVIETFART